MALSGVRACRTGWSSPDKSFAHQYATRKRRPLACAVSLLLLSVSLFFPQTACRAAGLSGTLKIGGTGSILATMKAFAAEHQRSNPETSIEVLPSIGSGGGIRAVRKGAIDIGLSSRPLHPGEEGDDLEARAFARTPFVFIADPRCDCDPVTDSLLASLLAGKVHSWSSGERVRLVLRPPQDSDTLLVRSISPELDAAMESALLNDGLLTARTDQDSADAVETTPGALGFSTLAQVRSEKRRVKLLPYRGVEPTLESLAAGEYILEKTYLIVVRKDAGELAWNFLEFLFSDAGAEILRRSGSLPLPETGEGR